MKVSTESAEFYKRYKFCRIYNENIILATAHGIGIFTNLGI